MPCLTTLLQLNILVSDSRRACLADFGFSSNSTVTASTHKGMGTVRWMAPELFDPQNTQETTPQNTQATDVYSFALVCYEAS